MVSRTNAWLGICLVLLTAGCASTHTMLRYQADDTESATVWPAPPETPRYRYIGQLTGEENIQVTGEGAFASAGTRFFKWLVGLTSAKHTPVILQRPQGVMVDESGRLRS